MPPTITQTTKLGICIATFNRAEGLERLLESILSQKDLEQHRVQIRIAIADNLTPPSSQPLVEKYKKNFGLDIAWNHEPVQGISYARNTSVKLAGDSDLFLFVDDDEILDDFCISHLLKTRSRYNADLVYGNSPPVFKDDKLAPHIKHYFEHPPGTDGQRLPFAPTNCLLVDGKFMKGNKDPFDPAFARSGGEDTYFTMKLVDKGAKLVKSERAFAYNIVDIERCAVPWILRRVKRQSAVFSQIILKLRNGPLSIATRLIKLQLKFILGLILFLPYLLFSSRKKLVGVMLITDSFGGLLGFVNYRIASNNFD